MTKKKKGGFLKALGKEAKEFGKAGKKELKEWVDPKKKSKRRR